MVLKIYIGERGIFLVNVVGVVGYVYRRMKLVFYFFFILYKILFGVN